MARQGGVVASYRRPAGASPAEFWTTVATGRAPADHGVVALDGYRLPGMSATLTRTGPWRFYFSTVAAPLGLAEQRPLLSNRRLAPTFWELVARGGRPVAAVDWWGTYPADAVPGLVVAHGAYDLLASGAPDVVAPPGRRGALLALRETIDATGTPADRMESLAAASRTRIWRRALAPDAFYRRIAAQAATEARALALYLPAADLAAAGWPGPPEALSELVGGELRAADRLLAELAPGMGTIMVVVDPGRRGGDAGRALVWNGTCAAEARPHLDPRAIAAGLLRGAGLAQSRELPAPPAFCRWAVAPADVPTYGQRSESTAPGESGRDYLETLRALGYL